MQSLLLMALAQKQPLEPIVCFKNVQDVQAIDVALESKQWFAVQQLVQAGQQIFYLMTDGSSGHLFVSTSNPPLLHSCQRVVSLVKFWVHMPALKLDWAVHQGSKLCTCVLVTHVINNWSLTCLVIFVVQMRLQTFCCAGVFQQQMEVTHAPIKAQKSICC